MINISKDIKAVFANNLSNLLDEHGLERRQLSEKLGVKYSTLNTWLQGFSLPRAEALEEIATYFNVSVASLLEDTKNDENKLNNYVRIGVYGTIPAGIPTEAIEYVEDYEDIPVEWTYGNKEYIGLKVKGDSMYPEYMDGDIVIVLKQSDFINGQDCVVFVNGYDATLKRCYKTIEGIQLRPLNANYAPKTYGQNDEDITILGVVKEIRRKVL